MSAPIQFDLDLFCVLLYRNNGRDVLLESTPNGFRLPIVAIPKHQRIAEEMTGAIKSLWNLDTYCLFPLVSIDARHAHSCGQVAEVLDRDANVPAGMHWLPAASLSAGALDNRHEYDMVERSLAAMDGYRCGRLSGAFGKPNWLREVTGWVREHAASASLTLTGKFRQLNAAPSFSLIRFETDGPALWFKAVGAPNLHEYSITQTLAMYFPAFVPRLLAVHPGWNSWLAVEADGVHPDSKSNPNVCRAIAGALAELQIASLGKSQRLLEAGCQDARISTLAEFLEPFFPIMEELMAQQTKPTPAPLTPSELSQLRLHLAEVLAEWRDLDIPDVIGHFDLNPGNIIVSDDHCVFLDWAEGHVGPPFLTFTYVAESIRKFTRRDVAIEAAFASPWRRFLSPKQIDRAIGLAPLLAVFGFATCGCAWRDANLRGRPENARYLRSLTRRMKSEADRVTDQRCA